MINSVALKDNVWFLSPLKFFQLESEFVKFWQPQFCHFYEIKVKHAREGLQTAHDSFCCSLQYFFPE